MTTCGCNAWLGEARSSQDALVWPDTSFRRRDMFGVNLYPMLGLGTLYSGYYGQWLPMS